MKTHSCSVVLSTLSAVLLLWFANSAGRAAVALPPPVGTNNLPAYIAITRASAAQQEVAYLEGRLDQLDSEVNRAQKEFLLLAILFGSAVVTLCLLVARDFVRGTPVRKGAISQTQTPTTASICSPTVAEVKSAVSQPVTLR